MATLATDNQKNYKRSSSTPRGKSTILINKNVSPAIIKLKEEVEDKNVNTISDDILIELLQSVADDRKVLKQLELEIESSSPNTNPVLSTSNNNKKKSFEKKDNNNNRVSKSSTEAKRRQREFQRRLTGNNRRSNSSKKKSSPTAPPPGSSNNIEENTTSSSSSSSSDVITIDAVISKPNPRLLRTNSVDNDNNNNNIEPVIATRCSEEVFQFCSETIDNLHYYENARIMTLKEDHERAQKQKETDNNNDTIRGKVCIVCAGTSDVNVAEEIAITLELQSTPRIQVERYYDIGVAGLHRMLSVLPELRDDENDVIVCCAGMDGALPSVLAGLVPQPIIAVPTSIGYGVSQGGMSALNSILNSCSPGVGALNIDNGFGAACLVMKMIRPRGVH